jgi:glycosyltransferase involved in cell wall biosynthesis
VVVPVLNEERVIGSFLERWSGRDWDLLFVDGMSTDATVAVVEEFSRQLPADERAVSVLRTQKRNGLAGNSCLGLQAALSRGYEYIIVADAGTQHPDDAEWMLGQLRELERETKIVPRGSYFLPGSAVHSFPFYRRVVSAGAAFVCSVLLGGTGTYPTHAFKVWPRKALEEIPFHGLVDGSIAHCLNGPEFQVGMTWLALQHGWSVPEFPMNFHGSKSTFRWSWIPRFMREIIRLRRYRAVPTI